MTAQYLLGAAAVAEIYKEYDCFAYFYNKYWTINAPLYLEKALDILLLEKLEKNAHILDAQGKSQSQTSAAVSDFIGSGIKHFKNLRFLIIGNSRAVVRDRYHDPVIFLFQVDFYN